MSIMPPSLTALLMRITLFLNGGVSVAAGGALDVPEEPY